MATNPSLTVINPSTGQPYTAIELADAQVQRTYQQSYGGLPDSKSNAYNQRATVQGDQDDFSKYLSTGYIIGQDNEEQRAQLQPWTEQLWNSTQKMAGTAVTTFLDGTAGLAAGLINVAVGDREQGSAYNRFIDNEFSNAMLDWQKKMELALPNYQTKQEQESPWYENMFSASGAANFWGESILKNLGFAIGAMGSGALTGIGLESALGMAELRTTSKLLEGLSKSIQEGKTLTAAETKIAASLTEEGLASLKNGEVLNELTQTAKAIKSKTAINQAVSSFVGSIGEGRIEALQNSSEFKDLKTEELKQALNNGEITTDEFTNKLQNLDKEVENYQNALFTANVALLSLSNYTQFKNVFAKSYTPNKLLTNEILNTTEKGLYEIAEKSKFRSFIDYSKQLIKDPLMEMTEEQSQYMLQKAADSYYSMRLDDEANGTVQNYIKSLGKGFAEAYGTAEGWENAFSGFIIGGLGIPTIKKSSGKLGLKLALEGGMYGEYKEIKNANAKFRKDVDTVNTLLEGNITKQLYDSQVIDNKLESMNKEAVIANDKVTSKTISAMQLANTVDAFINIGKYDDLITKIKDENELTVDEIKKKYDGKVTSQLTGKESTVPYFKGMTEEQIKKYIERKSKKAIDQAEVLKKIKQDIDIRFGDYPEGARKDLFLKAAAVQDIDERITELLLDVKTQTGNRFARGINKNFTPEMVLYMADFSGLNTPVDLEQFLKKKKGLENYRRLLREYLDYEEDSPEQALKFAEKARDLYGLVLQRQAMNDGYFKMADKRYAENAEALANSAAEEKFMGQSTKDIRYKQFYDAHTNEDPEFGFESSIFQIDTDEEDVLTVEGIANKTGASVKLENARPVTENPKLVDEEGNAAVRTSKAGDKYATYKATVDGKEVTVEVKNPVETKTKKLNNISLRFLKGDANTMVDQDGNVYSLEDLEQDPAFLKSKIITRDQQRQDLYDKVRIETLQKLLKNNSTLIDNIIKRKAAIQETVKEAEELLKRARANKSGRVSVTLDGVRTVFTIFGLENNLADYKKQLAELDQQWKDLAEENRKAMRGIEEAKNQGFNRAAFNKAILEDVATLQKQIKDVQDARDNAEATTKRLEEVITALKALVKVIYPKFKKLYTDIYGVDPSTVNALMVKWQSDVTPLLRALRVEERDTYLNLRVEESKLKEAEDILNEIQKYMDDSQKMADSLMKERALFEDELAARLAARRASQKKGTPKKTEPKGYTKEIDAEQDNLAAEFVSPKPSVTQAFKTAGRDTQDDDTPNPNKAQQRWSKTVSRIRLNDGAYSLRVLTADQRPDLFIDAEGNPLPPDMMKEALAVVLYRNGKPVDANLQPLGEDATEDQLIYNFIPLPKLQSKVKGKTYDKFYDSEQNPELAAAMMQKLEDFRNLLFERAKAGTNSFLPVTSKSLGLLDTTGAKRTGDRDLTTAVWDTLLGGDESTRGKKLAQSRIEIAKATSPEDVEQGWGWIVVGGKEVKVKNGLAYFITNDDIVVPLLSRKLTASETQTAFDLLVAMTESEELSLTPEGAGEVKTTTTTKKKKGKAKFVKLKGPNNSRIKNEGEARAAAARLNKKTGKYYSVYYNKGAKAWGYNQYEKTKLTKEQAEAARKAKSQDSIKIYDYLKNLLYFGKQTRSEESLLPTNVNPQTEIYLKEGKLHFYDLEKKAKISIDFTAESLTQNQDTLMAFLANKYHQISNTDLGKKGTHLEVTRVVFDENGKPLYVETVKHTNYTSYLISNKDSNGNTRRTENIPLTTNARTDINNDLVVKSTYLGYSEDPAHIKEQASTGAAPTATPGAPVRTPTVNTERESAASLLAEVEKHIENKVVSIPIIAATFTKLQAFAKPTAALVEMINNKISPQDDEFSTLLKQDPSKSEDYNSYSTLLGIKQVLQAYIQELDNATAAAPSAAPITPQANDSLADQLTAMGNNSELFDEDGEFNFSGEEDSEDNSEDMPEEFEEGGEENNEEDNKADPNNKLRTQITGSPIIDINKAKAWLAENLPQVNVKIHDKLINGIAQGKLSIDGLLHISKLAEEGSEYHEALHGVMLGILTDEELAEVYKEAKKLYGEPTEADLTELKKIYPKYNKTQLITAFYDEKLAEDFRTYALSGGKEYPTSTLGKIFKTILDAIKAFLNLRPSGAINGMFYDLYNGKYKDRKYDLAKVKSRLQGSARFSALSWSKGTRTVDPVTAQQFTKEVTHVMVSNLFKVLFNDNNSIADLKRMEVRSMEGYLNDALLRTKMQIDAQPESQFTKIFNGFYANRKNVLKTVVREYLQNDLGIDLGLYKVEGEDETQKIDRDSSAWAKDSSTIHPREGTNAFVKLMVASLPSYIRDTDGNMVQETGDLLGMPMLVRPNNVFNHLLALLHKSTTFDDRGDSNSMVAVLRREAENVPYLQHLLSLLTDETNLAKDWLEANNLITAFQQSMYKTALNYKLWLINEGDVISTDPNSESAEDRTIANWRAKLVDTVNTAESIIIKPKDGGAPKVNTKNVAKIAKSSTFAPNTFEYYMDVLNKIGINFDVRNSSKYTTDEINAFMINAKYLIEEMSSTIQGDRDLDYIFNKTANGRLFALAAIAAGKNFESTDLQHIGPDGKTRYGVSEHNMISMLAEFIDSMPVGTPISDLLDKDFGKYPGLNSVYLNNSHFIQNVLFEKNPEDGKRYRTNVPFKVTIIEGARPNKPGEEGAVNTKSDKRDRTWMSFNSILKGVFPILRTSDKSLEYAIDLGNPIIELGKVNQRNSEMRNVFKGYLADELLLGKQPTNANIANFTKNLGDGVYFFQDILSGKVPAIRPDESVKDYIEKNENLINKAIDDYFIEHDTSVIQRLLDNNLINFKYTEFGSFVTLKALDVGLTELLVKANINVSKTDKGVTLREADFNNLIRAFTLSSLIGNIEQTKLFFGHPAFYKTTVELYKRTAGGVGTKKVAIVDERMNTFIRTLSIRGKAEKDNKVDFSGRVETIVLEEPVTISSYLAEIRKSFVEKYGAERGKKYADKYANMDEADGQGYITLPEYREFRARMGEWGRVEENLYQRAMRGEKINPVAISTTFNILKAQYFGLNKVDGLSVPVYLKFSLMPLIPSVYAGTNIESTAESMMANGQGIAVYPSGIKIGGLFQKDGNFYPMYQDIEDTGDYVGNPIDPNANVLSLDYRFMGLQVSTNEEIKENTTRGSQQAKLIISDRYENGVCQPITIYRDNEPEVLTPEATDTLVKEYHNTANAITEKKAEEILKEIGAIEVRPGVYRISNSAKVSRRLIQAARNRNSPENLIDSLQTEELEGEVRFKYLLDGVPNRNKIENLLFSIINNTVITQKFNGGARIQAASTGFEKGPRTYDFKDGKARLTSNPDLRFYTKGAMGETLPAQVKMAPNKDMMKLIQKAGGIDVVNAKLKKLWELKYDDDGNVSKDSIRYNEKAIEELELGFNPAILQFVGYRIPTQGMNTIEHLEIAEFLDPLAGEAIHLPSEIVAKSGGDYDIDKLSIYLKYFDENGNPSLDTNTLEGLHNKLIRINQDFLRAPENYNDLLIPNDPSTLKALAGEETKISKTQSLTWGHNLDTGEYYLVGKDAVGIVARHRTHHTLTQQANVTINKVYKGGMNKDENTLSVLNFEGCENNYSLAGINDAKKENKIGDIISEFLSAFVDVAKDPFVFRINASTNTADTYMYLIRRGVPIETAVKFMTQPVIIEYFRTLAGSSSMIDKMNGTDRSSYDIIKELEAKLSTAFKTLGGDADKIASKAFSTEDLAKNVNKKMDANLSDITFLRSQIQVLKDFRRYTEQASNLRELMDATSDDTVRHKNFNALDSYAKRMDQVRKSAMFDMASVQRIFDNTLIGGFQKAQMLHEAYRSLFEVTENPKIKTALDNLRDYLIQNKVNEDSINNILDKAKNDLIVHVFSSQITDVNKLLETFFTSDSAVANEISKTLKSPNPAVRKNPFLKNIVPLLENPRSDVKGLKMFNVKLTTFEFNQLVNGFRGLPEMYQKKLAAFILLQSGLDNSSDTWYDKVPVNVMHSILEKGIVNFTSTLDTFDTDHFLQEFVRNNTGNFDLVPSIGVYKAGNTGYVKIDKTGTLTGLGQSGLPKKYQNRLFLKVRIDYPEFAGNADAMSRAKVVGIPTGEYLLLVKDPKTGVFKLANKAGDRLMKEFKGVKTPSLLNRNNISKGMFRDEFSKWSEPEMPTVPKNSNTLSQGEALQKEC